MHQANPRAFILNVEGVIDNSCLENQNGTKYNAVLLYCSIECLSDKKLSQWHHFQVKTLAVISTIHMLIFIG